MLTRVAAVLSMLLALTGGLVVFGKGSLSAVRLAAASSERSTSITLGGVTYANHGTKDVRNLAKLDLEADDYYFSPTFLRGRPGQKLTLLVESDASTLHNLSIPALGIDKDVPPRGKVEVNVTFPASGVLAFSCKFHGSRGMNGQLLTNLRDSSTAAPR